MTNSMNTAKDCIFNNVDAIIFKLGVEKSCQME